MKMGSKYLFSVFLYLIFLTITYSQEESLVFRYLNNKNGRLKMHGALSEDLDGRMWIGTWGMGLFVYDGYHFRHFYKNSMDSLSLDDDYIVSFYCLPNGKILAGTRYEGFIEIDLQHELVKHIYFKDKNGKRLRPYSESVIDVNGDLWAGSNKGLLHLSLEKGTAEVFLDELKQCPDPSFENFVMRIVKDSKKEIIWVGSKYGLKKFDLRKKKYVSFQNPPKWHNVSPQWKLFDMWDLQMDSHGKLWMAAMASGGILSYNPNTDHWDEFLFDKNAEKPYDGNAIYSVMPVNDSTVYFTGKLGLGKIDFQNHKLKLLECYDMKKGGIVRETWVDNNGILWLSGRAALMASQKPVIKKSRRAYIPSLISFMIDHKAITPKQQPVLAYKKHDIQIEIGVINPPMGTIQYRWKFSTNKDWNVLDSTRMIQLRNLSFGAYCIDFESKLGHEHWQKGDAICFQVQKPFYFEWAFIFTFLSIISMLTGIFVWYRKMVLNRKMELKRLHEKELAETEMKSLRSQLNPHFIFNSLNSISSLIYKSENENAVNYLAKFSKLLRKVLRNSEKQLITLEEEINVSLLYLELEKARFEGKFDFTIEIDSKLDAQTIYMPPLLLQPYLENAVWHGILHKDGFGLVCIHVKGGNSKIIIEITDNGIGRKASKRNKPNIPNKEKSFGLNITKNRLNYINLVYNTDATITIIDLKDTTENPIGTKVIIDLPFFLNNSYESNHSR